jgi:hypothetical protein
MLPATTIRSFRPVCPTITHGYVVERQKGCAPWDCVTSHGQYDRVGGRRVPGSLTPGAGDVYHKY